MSFRTVRKREVTQPIAYCRAGEESALLKVEVGSFFKKKKLQYSIQQITPSPFYAEDGGYVFLWNFCPTSALILLPPTN